MPTIIPRNERERIIGQEARAAADAELAALKREVAEAIEFQKRVIAKMIEREQYAQVQYGLRLALESLNNSERLAYLSKKLSKENGE